MIIVVNAENRRLFESDLAEMHRQRKTVFVDRAGWAVPVIGDLEVDAYDREDTIYLLAKDQTDGPLLASVRLLSTIGPHLMCKLFHAVDLQTIPRGSAVWEVSRFCTAPDVRGARRRHTLLWEIICGVIETGLLYGIEEVIFAASRALLPLALCCGWEARTLGPRLRGEDGDVTAGAATITAAGLRTVRQRHGIPIPITRIHAITSHGLDPIDSGACADVLSRPAPAPAPGVRPWSRPWSRPWGGKRPPGQPRHG